MVSSQNVLNCSEFSNRCKSINFRYFSIYTILYFVLLGLQKIIIEILKHTTYFQQFMEKDLELFVYSNSGLR